MAYDREKLFTRIGKFVRGHRLCLMEISGHHDTFVDLFNEARDLTAPGGGMDQKFLDRFQNVSESAKKKMISAASQFKTAAQGFLQDFAREMIDERSTNIRDILKRLRSEMTAAGDYVKAGNIAHTEPVYDQANTGNGTFSWDNSNPTDQCAMHGALFTAECVEESSDGGKFDVHVKSPAFSGYVGQATVGSAFSALYGNADENTEVGVKFTIADGATDWDIGDKIYFSTWWYPDISETNDGDNQISNWKVDRLGLWQKPYTTLRKLYAALSDASGVRTLDIYQDDGLATLLATGSVTGDGEVYCVPENDIDGLGVRADIAYSGDDNDIYITMDEDYEGLFQYFFINILGQRVPMPTSGSGSQVTESWAT